MERYEGESSPRKRRSGAGRKMVYSGTGAPLLSVRLEPDVHKRVTERPEGPRKYLERLVRKDATEEDQGGAGN